MTPRSRGAAEAPAGPRAGGSIDRVLARIVATALQMLDCERATLYVLDPGKNGALVAGADGERAQGDPSAARWAQPRAEVARSSWHPRAV